MPQGKFAPGGRFGWLILRKETLYYLRYIEYFWETLLLRDQGAKQSVGHATVKALELRAPGMSTQDANMLRGQILGSSLEGCERRIKEGKASPRHGWYGSEKQAEVWATKHRRPRGRSRVSLH